MILELIFLTIGFCVPQGDTYDCTWQIILIETQPLLIETWKSFQPELELKDDGKWLLGFESNRFKSIWIWKLSGKIYNEKGCSVLWHEILHAWGYTEEQIPLCSWNPGVKK